MSDPKQLNFNAFDGAGDEQLAEAMIRCAALQAAATVVASYSSEAISSMRKSRAELTKLGALDFEQHLRRPRDG